MKILNFFFAKISNAGTVLSELENVFEKMLYST